MHLDHPITERGQMWSRTTGWLALMVLPVPV
jgi:hypothetical protein